MHFIPTNVPADYRCGIGAAFGQKKLRPPPSIAQCLPFPYSQKKARRGSETFEFEFFGNASQNSSTEKKKHSDARLKNQEKRLQENGLLYESKETYNPKTKRTSRVLVCLHSGCGKEFKKTRNLIIHSRVHTKVRPHV